jgi:hypothetical protein
VLNKELQGFTLLNRVSVLLKRMLMLLNSVLMLLDRVLHALSRGGGGGTGWSNTSWKRLGKRSRFPTT